MDCLLFSGQDTYTEKIVLLYYRNFEEIL